MNSSRPLNNFLKGGFFAIFFLTGFSALIFQVIWQRVLIVHAGVDLYSVTTVVAAFMAGLGLGSLIGGYIADRINSRNCFLLFITSNWVIGIFGLISLWLFYDFYGNYVTYFDSTTKSFIFHFILLCIPTTFMGLSLPLLSKALVRTDDEMSSLVGALYGINTLGAAVGAGLGTWYILGTFGFSVSIKIASSINIICGLIAIILLPKLKHKELEPIKAKSKQEPSLSQMDYVQEEWLLTKRPGIWIFIYGLTGFAALSLEIAWFRILNVTAEAHTYVFGHILFIFLCGLGLGSLLVSRIIKKISRPDILFLLMQYLIGVMALLCPMLLISIPEASNTGQFVKKLIGFMPPLVFDLKHFTKYFISINFITIFIFGLATVFMGACFPLIQRIVSRQMDALGRSLSKLLFSNIVGNILGSIITGFFLLDYLGTPATLKIISGMLIIPGIAAAFCLKSKTPRFLSIIAVSLLSIVLIIAFPKDQTFWTFFHAVDVENMVIKEDRTSLNTLSKNYDGKYYTYINGRRQSWIPYSGTQSLIGTAPTLYHRDPKTALVIGLASGSTAYSVAIDKRLESIKVVELSGGLVELLKEQSSKKPLWQLAKFFQSPHVQIIKGDGRKFLLHSKEKFDIIVVDVFGPRNSGSGNLYSAEFLELVKQRLNPGGIFAQWIPSTRFERTMLRVFPYVRRFGKFSVLATNEPLHFDETEIAERLSNLNLYDVFEEEQAAFSADYFKTTLPLEIQSGKVADFSDKEINLDLFPRDEYFLNNKVDKKNMREPIDTNDK